MKDAARERLIKIDSCAVSDALDALGLKGTVKGIGAISAGRRIAGRVQTVKLGPASDNVPKRHLCSAAVDAAAENDVIVIENLTTEIAAGWGGILSRAAKTKGLSGTIVEGPARDADESNDIGYPVFARSATSFTARGRIAEHAWDVPISVGGVNVEPGDLVIADGSGVVFIPKVSEAQVIEKAEEIAAREAAMAAAVEAGKPVSEVMGGDYENMLTKK
ncbi:MAG: RraA family protein [Rhodospirillales bacterium]|nr:RraA family protein [Rhodospirillales bacterium]